MKEKKYVLLTGCTGFLGYSVVHSLLQKKYVPILLARGSSSLKRFDDVKDKIEIISVDFLDKNSIATLIKTLRAKKIKLTATIYALGATKAKNKATYQYINAEILALFHGTFQEKKYSLGKFIFVSSLSVHGHQTDPNKIISTNDKLNPSSYYALSKERAEHYVTTHVKCYTIVRPAIIFGAYDKEPLILYKMLSKGIQIFFANASNNLGFIHAEDLSCQMIAYIEGNFERQICIGCSHNMRINDYYNLIGNILNKKAPLRIVFPTQALTFCAIINEWISGIVYRSAPMFNRLKVNELTSRSWAATTEDYIKTLKISKRKQTPFTERVHQTIEWYKTHKWI